MCVYAYPYVHACASLKEVSIACLCVMLLQRYWSPEELHTAWQDRMKQVRHLLLVDLPEHVKRYSVWNSPPSSTILLGCCPLPPLPTVFPTFSLMLLSAFLLFWCVFVQLGRRSSFQGSPPEFSAPFSPLFVPTPWPSAPKTKRAGEFSCDSFFQHHSDWRIFLLFLICVISGVHMSSFVCVCVCVAPAFFHVRICAPKHPWLWPCVCVCVRESACCVIHLFLHSRLVCLATGSV
mgnify:CR=1 FL=1